MSSLEHYVPVLRWKRGEQLAISLLEKADQDSITPLIEIPPDDYVLENPQASANLSARLPRLSAALELARGSRDSFIDFGLLRDAPTTPGGREPILEFFDLLEGGGTQPIPVTGLTRPSRHQISTATVAARTRALALRLDLGDLGRDTLAREIEAILGMHSLTPNEVHLLIDQKLVGESLSSFAHICSRVPSISKWLTFTILGGSFPRDLTEFSVGTHFLPRLEWHHWRTEMQLSGRRLARFPTFGDYTTQHPIYYIPPAAANVSASVRYTSQGNWLVMRGEGLSSKGSPGYAQYPAIARLLCEQKEFQGPDFSEGDRYIWQIASREIGTTGNPETWLRAGINHHITTVVRQLTDIGTQHSTG